MIPRSVQNMRNTVGMMRKCNQQKENVQFIVIFSTPILILLITYTTECWKVHLKRQIGRWKGWQFFMGDGISDLGDPYRGWRHLCRSQSLTLYGTTTSRQTSLAWSLQILTFVHLSGCLDVEEALEMNNNLILKRLRRSFSSFGMPHRIGIWVTPPPLGPNCVGSLPHISFVAILSNDAICSINVCRVG